MLSGHVGHREEQAPGLSFGACDPKDKNIQVHQRDDREGGSWERVLRGIEYLQPPRTSIPVHLDLEQLQRRQFRLLILLERKHIAKMIIYHILLISLIYKRYF